MQSVEPITGLYDDPFIKKDTVRALYSSSWLFVLIYADLNSFVFLCSSLLVVLYILSSECKIKIRVKCVMSLFVMLELIP